MTTEFEMMLKLDWLCLRMEFLGEEKEQIVPALVGYLKDDNALHDHGIARGGAKLSGANAIALQFHVPKSVDPNTTETRPLASVRVRKAKGDGVAAFVDIHPPGLTPYGSGFVVDYLLRGVLNRTPHEILSARVTRIDLALDLHGVALGDFAWAVRGKRVRRAWVSEPEVRSLGFGSPKHGAVAVYRKDKATGPATGLWTRVEARLRPGCALQQVPALANPFARVDVTDVRAAWKALGRSPVEGNAMLSHAQLRGLKEVPALFPGDTPKPYRKVVAQALQAARPPWWDPSAAWQGFPAALSGAVPHAFGAAPPDALAA